MTCKPTCRPAVHATGDTTYRWHRRERGKTMNKNTERINIGKEAAALCKALGLDPPFVKEITLTPTTATITTYVRTTNGGKLLEPATPSITTDLPDEDVTSFAPQVPVTNTHTVEVRT